MSKNKVSFPGPGCLVEFMQGNSPMQAIVIEEQKGRLRLYGQNKRESNLAVQRLLPWCGPMLGSSLSRQGMDEALDERRKLRQELAQGISVLEVWELAQGEVEKATAEWLAGLIFADVDIDSEAALGHALLEAKSHFRFTPPDFEIFPAEIVESRRIETENNRVREMLVSNGSQFFQRLWDFSLRRGPQPENNLDDAVSGRLKSLLLAKVNESESADDNALWKQLTRSLPEDQNLAPNLAIAWGLFPENYNFHLDRADYERGESWMEAFAKEEAELKTRLAGLQLQRDESAFISIDPSSTEDRDDAFFVCREADSFKLKIAFACPGLLWPFGSALDKTVLRRASSIYLPEGDEHMLSRATGRDLFSLDSGVDRPALVLELLVDSAGQLRDIAPGLRTIRVSRNMDQATAENILAGDSEEAGTLQLSLQAAKLLQSVRIAAGAVITERPDPEIIVEGLEGTEQIVNIIDGPNAPNSQLIVSELMIFANHALSLWAMEHDIALFYRTQDVALPKEFAGIWSEPHEISRVVRALPAASLEGTARRHAGLGLSAYAPASSPLRRYADLFNQGQITSFLQSGEPLHSQAELNALLPILAHRSEAVGQIQRFRPRYWKLLYFKQQGDKKWWDAVVTEENDAFVSIALPWAQLMLRGRRRQFDDKITAGQRVQVRLGKINPLLNEIQILEASDS